jgi:hypothetical protein
MMVPTDVKFFFANDVLKGAPTATQPVQEQPAQPDDSDDPPAATATARRAH